MTQTAPLSPPRPKAATPAPTALEFFAGGGMARIGLEAAGFRTLFANDLDPAKCAAYRANFGDQAIVEGDVAGLRLADLPSGQADLAWASFPCQDLSLAGMRAGMSGAETRSGAFWPFWRLIEALDKEGRGPRLIVIENVLGLASSRGGADLAALAEAIAASNRRFAALAIDGALFTPQSRPRLFVIAWTGPAPAFAAPSPAARWTPTPLMRALSTLSGAAAKAHRPLDPPPPATPPPPLETVLEPAPTDVRWRSEAQVAALLAMMAPAHRERVAAAQRRAQTTGETQAGALYRRTREDGLGGRVQRAEVRFDIAGCLRTPAGGSSRQTLLLIGPDGAIRARLFSAREAARLMGLPDDYRLPPRYTDAYKLAGDGVVVGAARFLGENILRPILTMNTER